MGESGLVGVPEFTVILKTEDGDISFRFVNAEKVFLILTKANGRERRDSFTGMGANTRKGFYLRRSLTLLCRRSNYRPFDLFQEPYS